MCGRTRVSALADVTRISQHAHGRTLCHVFFGGRGDWTHLSCGLASHECVTVKETRFIRRQFTNVEVLDWPNAPSEQGTESSLGDNRMHATQNLQLNSAAKLNRLDSLREKLLHFFCYIYRHIFVSELFRTDVHLCHLADRWQYFNLARSSIVNTTRTHDARAEVAERVSEFNPWEHYVE